MFKVREVRFATAVGLMLVAGATITLGWRAASYGIAEVYATSENVDEVFQAYSNQLGAATFVGRNRLGMTPPSQIDPDSAIETVKGMLSISPLSSVDWFYLASLQNFIGAPPEDVLGALALSAMTGPNQQTVMTARAVMASGMLDQLPPDLRRTFVLDLVGVWPLMNEPSRQQVKAGLSRATEEARQELHAKLLLENAAGLKIIEALGLGAPAKAEPPRK